ncbi:2-amino-4-hydroxy-6-hydroxymethyldihydropteridine diphosphokinase [Marivirga lumbricoides]|uniref:2-amino-4-hydroxy-6-hydroxymethyldihydropteridine pyrophosphokinase n=1 Tax=Marivirga lumbricoides TaxID=1046115 RepID=A0ABQ1N6Z7_9BACT|nr:2-amino-4-hydroxy-6-hydroxymethyldihydropteridine diphosphokinase [Marivirga lumbricoides]
MEGIYVLLGTNMGEREENLQQALQLLAQNNIQILKLSSIYETAAWGKTDQQPFLNQVIEVSTTFNPSQLLQALLGVEAKLGRVRKEKWGERLIDLDILYYNDLIINSPHLQIPHTGIVDRRFTLVPLKEIAPDFIHPVHLKTQTTLLSLCKDELPVKRLK